MLKVNIAQLAASVNEAASFAAPEMNAGTSYLYNHVYLRLFNGEDVLLSDLDFDAFDTDDIRELNGLYHNVFDINFREANKITDTLRQSFPVCKPAAYV